jgi:hypothetical protein
VAFYALLFPVSEVSPKCNKPVEFAEVVGYSKPRRSWRLLAGTRAVAASTPMTSHYRSGASTQCGALRASAASIFELHAIPRSD